MPIRVHLSREARRRGFINKYGPYAGHISISGLMRATGAAYTTIHPMLRKPDNCTKLISFDLLSRLCRVLHCQPGDLLEYVPEGYSHMDVPEEVDATRL